MFGVFGCDWDGVDEDAGTVVLVVPVFVIGGDS